MAQPFSTRVAGLAVSAERTFVRRDRLFDLSVVAILPVEHPVCGFIDTETY